MLLFHFIIFFLWLPYWRNMSPRRRCTGWPLHVISRYGITLWIFVELIKVDDSACEYCAETSSPCTQWKHLIRNFTVWISNLLAVVFYQWPNWSQFKQNVIYKIISINLRLILFEEYETIFCFRKFGKFGWSWGKINIEEHLERGSIEITIFYQSSQIWNINDKNIMKEKVTGWFLWGRRKKLYIHDVFCRSRHTATVVTMVT